MEGIGVEHLTRVVVDGLRHQHLVHLLTGSHGHHHRLGSRRRAVVHRGIGDIHARQLRHHTLVFEDIMERALRDLCLIRGIGGQELGALEQTRYDRGCIMVIDTITGIAGQLFVLRAEPLEELAHLEFAHL